jgi:hypothetical protein
MLAHGENKVKIQILSVALLALTFMSVATAPQSNAAAGDTCSPPCRANQKCISQWNICAPIAIAPQGAMIVDPNTHTFDPNTEACAAIPDSDKVACAKKGNSK